MGNSLFQILQKNGLFAVPFGFIFLLSGGFVNILQSLAYVYYVIIKKDKQQFRIINQQLTPLNWSLMIFIAEWFGMVHLRLYGNQATFNTVGKHRALVVLNHCSDIDWLIGWMVADRFNLLGGTKALIKETVKYVPCIGWAFWFSEFIYLKRNWNADKSTLYSGFDKLSDFPIPYWLVVFPEGTRYTEKKHKESQEYAKKNNLPHLEHLLLPRSKGFIACAQGMQDSIESLYNVTITFKDQKVPSVFAIICGEEFVIEVHCNRIDPKSLPSEDKEIKEWLSDTWVQKDKLISYYHEHGTFEDEEIQVARSTFPVFIAFFWTSIWVFCTVAFITTCISGGWYWTLGTFTSLMMFVLVAMLQFTRSDRKKKSKKD